MENRPIQKNKDQDNQDGLVFIIDPDDRKNSSYKMVAKLPETESNADDGGDSQQESHQVIGFVKAHHKENKKFKIKGEKKQKEKIKGILRMKNAPIETEDDSTPHVVLHKKPKNHTIVGYIEVTVDGVESTDEQHFYVAIVKQSWLFILWWLIGLQIMLLCVLMVLFPYKAPEQNVPGQINQNGSS